MAHWQRSASLACVAGFAWPAAGLRGAAPRPEVVATGLEHPWARGFPARRPLPGDRAARAPARRRRRRQGRRARCRACRPSRRAGRAACWMWCSIRAFASNRTFYFCFSEPGAAAANSTALARAQLSADAQPAGGPEGDLQPAAEGREPQPFRLPHRRGAGRHAVPHAGRALQPQGRRAEARQPPRQDRAHRQGRLGAEGQPLRRPRRARCPRSGATATATARARRWRRTARCGCTSTARRAATRSTCRSRAATTAGR